MNRKPYPSDLIDEQWAVLEELLPPAKPGGCLRKHNMREVLNALFYHKRLFGKWSGRLFPAASAIAEALLLWSRS